MKKDIKDIYKEHMGHLKIDAKLYVELKKFRLKWMNKNKEHVEFLSGNLVGVNPIRFTNEDESYFFESILDTDANDLRKDVYKLEDIYKERNVTSNIFYITITYLMHEYMVSSLSTNNKNKAIRELYLIMAYKMFSSLTAHYFKFDLDRDVAVVTYERLSNRFLIKTKGYWQAVIEYRAQDVLLDNGLHVQKLKKFTAIDCTKTIQDIQGRLRSIMKELYVVIDDVIQNNDKRISKSLNAKDMEGNDIIAEVANLNANYYNFIKHIVFKKEDFIKDDLIIILTDLFKNLKASELRKTLRYISELSITKPNEINDILDTSLKANIEYLYITKMQPPYDKRIVTVVQQLRGYWSSSKVKDKHVLKVKKDLMIISKKATGRNTRWLLVTISLVIPIYIFLRAVTKDRYK